MSLASAAELRTLAFGDLKTGIWGAAWTGAPPFLALGAPGTSRIVTDLAVDGSAQDEWRVTADGVELVVAPEGDAAPSSLPEQDIDRFDQLCRVTGQVVIDGDELAVESAGSRGGQAQALDLERFDSLRIVSVWFELTEGLVLLSLRPARARGHDGDQLAAVMLEPDGPVAVAEPRLSTTYTGDGQPSRISMELWLGGDEEVEQFPRRAAGEAVSAGAAFELPGLGVRAELLRCHSRGREGTGMYLLLRGR
jgi:hypothetical protein